MPAAWIEIKSTSRIAEHDLVPLQRFMRDVKKTEAFCLSLDPIAKRIGGVRCLYWKEGLKELGLEG